MSRDGWRAFIAADGLDDWVVLHGGAAAVYRVGSLSDAVRLADAVAKVPGFAGNGAVLTLSDARLSVRLTRDVWQLKSQHIDVARAVSAVAREYGADADRAAVHEVQIAIAAQPADLDLGFWRAVLGYDAAAEDNAFDPLGNSSVVWLQELNPDKPLKHAMHLDVSVSGEDAQARVDAAVAAGGRIVVDESPASWILADRAGNKVCICAWPDGADPNM